MTEISIKGRPSSADSTVFAVIVAVSLAMTLTFLAMSLAIVAWIFKTGYRLKR